MKKPENTIKERKLYIETGKQKVVEVLCRYPDKEFSLSDLAKESNVRKSNIGMILDELNNMGFVEITKLAKIWRIKSNQTNWDFVKYKIIFNLGLIYQSNVVEFLMDYFRNPKAIILFGSFRKGEDITNSDIDIAIEVDDIKYKTIELREFAPFEKFLGKKIQMHLFNRKAVDINVFNNIANGIVLAGFLEVTP